MVQKIDRMFQGSVEMDVKNQQCTPTHNIVFCFQQLDILSPLERSSLKMAGINQNGFKRENRSDSEQLIIPSSLQFPVV